MTTELVTPPDIILRDAASLDPIDEPYILSPFVHQSKHELDYLELIVSLVTRFAIAKFITNDKPELKIFMSSTFQSQMTEEALCERLNRTGVPHTPILKIFKDNHAFDSMDDLWKTLLRCLWGMSFRTPVMEPKFLDQACRISFKELMQGTPKDVES